MHYCTYLLFCFLIPIVLLSQEPVQQKVYRDSFLRPDPEPAAKPGLYLGDYQRPDTTTESSSKNYAKRFQTFGAGGDLLNETSVESNEAGTDTRLHIIQLPRWSFFYQRQLLRRFPRVIGVLQLRPYRKEIDRISDLAASPMGVVKNALQENISIRHLYLFPGINYRLSLVDYGTFYIGGGITTVLPIRSERTVTIRDPLLSSYPLFQTIPKLVPNRIGYYAQVGVQMRFPTGIGFGMNLRQEELDHSWGSEQKEGVFISDYFNPYKELAKGKHFMVQFELFYSW